MCQQYTLNVCSSIIFKNLLFYEIHKFVTCDPISIPYGPQLDPFGNAAWVTQHRSWYPTSASLRNTLFIYQEIYGHRYANDSNFVQNYIHVTMVTGKRTVIMSLEFCDQSVLFFKTGKPNVDCAQTGIALYIYL